MILNLPDISETRSGKELIARGFQQGLQQVREGMLASVLKIGEKRFGAASAALKKKLARCSIEQLAHLVDVVLDAKSWRDVNAAL